MDLDDYNNELEEGLHITSMAGTWMSIVEGFGGLRIVDNQVHIDPKIPNIWKAFSFKINFRGTIINIKITKQKVTVDKSNKDLMVYCKGKLLN